MASQQSIQSVKWLYTYAQNKIYIWEKFWLSSD